MKQHSSLITTKTPAKVASAFIDDGVNVDTRVGQYYSLLSGSQKKRFGHITKAIQRNLKMYPRRNPVETILIRQIAFNTLRIEEAEIDVLKDASKKYSSDVEKWIFLARKERREAITTLFTIIKLSGKKDKKGRFDDLRNVLRAEEDLPPVTVKKNPDGHDRRYHDEITRTDG